MKVIKNRTAYFNQSMMEVSVLDLVCFSRSYSLLICFDTQLTPALAQHKA